MTPVVASIVAIDGLADIQVPPGTASLSVVDVALDRQERLEPTIDPAKGADTTLKVVMVEQNPEFTAYDMVSIPGAP